jgi:putative hydrolase of the HAD superfamily
MMRLEQIDTWIFDLDNTLYAPGANLFSQVDARIGAFVGDLLGLEVSAARKVQKDYFYTYGTTLSGLMAHHDVDPKAYLDYVHDIDLSVLMPDQLLGERLARLPGRRLVFTNADSAYAWRVLEQLQIAEHFEAVHCVLATDLIPKPDSRAYDSLVRAQNLAPETAVFVEDMARNLKPAKALGMTTVWLDNGSQWGGLGAEEAHIDWTVQDLSSWLAQVVKELAAK